MHIVLPLVTEVVKYEEKVLKHKLIDILTTITVQHIVVTQIVIVLNWAENKEGISESHDHMSDRI